MPPRRTSRRAAAGLAGQGLVLGEAGAAGGGLDALAEPLGERAGGVDRVDADALGPVGVGQPGRGQHQRRVGGAAGEVIADKLPQMPSRWSPRGLSLRLGFSGIGGHELAGWPGAAVAGGAALASAFVGSHLRVMVRGREAQFAAAVFEDSLSYALVFAAMRGRD